MAALNLRVGIPRTSVPASTPTYVAVGTAPPNQRVKVAGFHLGLDDSADGDMPVMVEWGYAASAGAGGTPLAPGTIDQGAAETPQSAWTGPVGTAPSAPVVLDYRIVHPRRPIEVHLPRGREFVLKGGGVFFVAVTAARPVSVAGFLDIEE